MAGPHTSSKGSTGSRALRLAVANLVRLANADLSTAQLLLRDGRVRHAAGLADMARMHMIRAVAASEHGWRLKDWERGLAAVPEANPFRPALAAVGILALGPPGAPIRADGQLVPEPDADQVADALERLTATLGHVAAAFAVEMAGTGPAGHVAPIRPQPAPEPAEPETSVGNQVTGPGRDRRRPVTSAPLPEPPPAKHDRDPDPVQPPAVVRSRPGTRPRPGPGPARIVGQGAKASPSPAPPRAAVLVKQPHPPPASSRSGSTSPIVTRPAPRPEPVPAQDPQAPARVSTYPAGAVASGPPLTTPREPDRPSAAFWSLMARWKVPDLAALALIGHPGGLTKKGTRPRFRVAGEEATLFSFLQEIDSGLQLLGTAPDIWLRQPIAAAPFDGATPLEHIARQHQDGARATIRRIMQVGLQGRT